MRMADWDSTGAGSCFGTPGDDNADEIRAIQFSIPRGKAVEAKDVDAE